MRRWFRGMLVWLLRRAYVTETIGQKECPLMMRWSLWLPGPKKSPWFKVLLHYFPPNVTDRDPHDHPRSFVTLILKGSYFNTEWEKSCQGSVLLPVGEWMRRGRFCFRPADHLHITETADAGAWTLVIMGPEKRDWGFVRDGVWFPWMKYVERYGGVVRCDAPPDMMGEDKEPLYGRRV